MPALALAVVPVVRIQSAQGLDRADCRGCRGRGLHVNAALVLGQSAFPLAVSVSNPLVAGTGGIAPGRPVGPRGNSVGPASFPTRFNHFGNGSDRVRAAEQRFPTDLPKKPAPPYSPKTQMQQKNTPEKRISEGGEG